jgi:cytochrome c peroxidase
MLRWLLSGLTVAVCASVAIAQQPDLFDGRFDRSHPALSWGHGDRLVSLGERLFFDPRLSRTRTTACARCHDPGYAFAEPRRVSTADNGRQGRRNAPSLIDVAFLPTLMWDGRFRSLEQQALSPFQRGEMGIDVEEAVERLNADREYAYLFRTILGQRPTASGMASALAAFQRTLLSRESRVDRFLLNDEPGALTRLERDGFHIFNRRAPCSNCHELFPLRSEGTPNRRPLFTDFGFHNLGVGYRSGRFADSGRYGLTRVERDIGAFRTPSLRNSARTPPYMHDGSLATLEEVVEFYNAGGRPNPYLSPLIRPLFLDGYEKAALVAFLRALTDQEYAHRWGNSNR